jgi:hypothetical protein
LPGKQNGKADALSRREQDLPNGDLDDPRLQFRNDQVLEQQGKVIRVRITQLTKGPNRTKELKSLEELWTEAEENDQTMRTIKSALQKGERALPAELKNVRVSLADCSLDNQKLLYRNRRWVPQSEPLRTRIIQETHDSAMSCHPGRSAMVNMVARQFFWPGFVEDIRRFVRNCRTCGRTKIWRDRKQGLLQPLPVPERQWQDISMDFIGPLPESQGHQHILVIVDRLGKGVILVPCKEINAEEVAKAMINVFYRQHGMPSSIVSDRGPQFTSNLWKRFCQLLKIERRLSTAYHPETDGQTERANAEIEVLL